VYAATPNVRKRRVRDREGDAESVSLSGHLRQIRRASRCATTGFVAAVTRSGLTPRSSSRSTAELIEHHLS
jgi:hypothetical protein